MKRLLLFFLVFNIGVLKFYAQISPSSPNTFPAIGNVGIGTLLPLEKLHVNGNVLTDGNLIVKGKIYLKSSLIGRDVSIDSSLEVKGLTTLNSLKLNLSSTNSSGSTDNTGNFQVSNLPNAKNVQETYFLRIDENGNISKSSVADPFIESSLVDPCEAFQTQYWKSQTNKKSLVTGCSDTKVGIGTDSPIYQLQVMGQSYSNQLSIGNSLQTNISDEFTALRINGRGRGSAIEIDMTEENNDYQKMFFAHFQNPQTKIFKIINKSNNNDPKNYFFHMI